MFGSVGVKLVSVAAVRAGVHFPVVQVDVHLGVYYTTSILVLGAMYSMSIVLGSFYTSDKLLHLWVAKWTTSTADLRKQDP